MRLAGPPVPLEAANAHPPPVKTNSRVSSSRHQDVILHGTAAGARSHPGGPYPHPPPRRKSAGMPHAAEQDRRPSTPAAPASVPPARRTRARTPRHGDRNQRGSRGEGIRVTAPSYARQIFAKPEGVHAGSAGFGPARARQRHGQQPLPVPSLSCAQPVHTLWGGTT
jgi:hypothetical protein